MSKYSEAQNRASQKYQREHLEQLRVWVQKGQLDRFKAAASASGQSLAAFTCAALNEKIQRDGLEDAQIVQEDRPEGQAAEDHVTAKQMAAAPFTEEERANIIKKLPNDVMLQFAIRDSYGEAVLSDLLEEAREAK